MSAQPWSAPCVAPFTAPGPASALAPDVWRMCCCCMIEPVYEGEGQFTQIRFIRQIDFSNKVHPSGE
jgi:hypothetical protein